VSRKAVVGGGGIGILVIALLGLFFGFDPGAIFQGGSSVQAPSAPGPHPGGQPSQPGFDDQLKDFISVVLADTEDVWQEVFSRSGPSGIRARPGGLLSSPLAKAAPAGIGAMLFKRLLVPK
jgi:uncharacterized protein